METTKKNQKKPVASSTDYNYLDKRIQKTENTVSTITKKTQEEIKKWIEKKNEISPEIKESFAKILFLNLQKWLNNSKIANEYLFTLIKWRFQNKLYDGIYKIDVIKQNDNSIICKLVGENNYQTTFSVENKEIMNLKPVTDTLETWYTWGKKEDFVEEIQYGDSVIMKVQGKKMTKIHPDDILDEVAKYIKEPWDPAKSAKKIWNAINMLNESKNQNASEYIKDFFKLVREKQKKRKWKKEMTKEEFAEVLKRFINKEPAYVHTGDDIDKASVEFLLKELGIDKLKKFNEVEHDETDTIKEGIFYDLSWTVNGLKTVNTTDKTHTIDGEKITKVKIASEHSDKSDKALLSNRPSSTTQIVFAIFKQLGAIDEKLPQIERFVNFVNTVDSMNYQISSIDYKHNYQTMFGLYRMIPIRKIFDYFIDPTHTWFERLPDEYMRNIIVTDKKWQRMTLKEKAEGHKEKIQKDIQWFKEIQHQGNRELEYNGTKFIVDIENKLRNGPQSAGYYGYGFFTIYPDRGNIYIYSPKKLPAVIEGFPTDGHFLIINNPTQKDLETIIDKFSTEKNKKTSLKNDMVACLKHIQEKKENKPISKEELEDKITRLPKLKKEDIMKEKTYTGIINSIQNKIAFITIDKDREFKVRLKVENKTELSEFSIWDKVKVRFSLIEESDDKVQITVKSMRHPNTNTQ